MNRLIVGIISILTLAKFWIALYIDWQPYLIGPIGLFVGFYVAFTVFIYSSLFRKSQLRYDYSDIVTRQRGLIFLVSFVLAWSVLLISLLTFYVSGSYLALLFGIGVVALLMLFGKTLLQWKFAQMMVNNGILQQNQIASRFINDRWIVTAFPYFCTFGAFHPLFAVFLPPISEMSPDQFTYFTSSLLFLILAVVTIFLAMILEPPKETPTTYSVLVWFYRRNRTYTIITLIVRTCLLSVMFLSQLIAILPTIPTVLLCVSVLVMIEIYDRYEVKKRIENLGFAEKEKQPWSSESSRKEDDENR